jgi:hypothetical protein
VEAVANNPLILSVGMVSLASGTRIILERIHQIFSKNGKNIPDEIIHTGGTTCGYCPWLGIRHIGCQPINKKTFRALGSSYPAIVKTERKKQVPDMHEAITVFLSTHPDIDNNYTSQMRGKG